MLKKSISLLLMSVIALGTFFNTEAQETKSSYEMWESIMLTPDNSKLKLLGEGLRKHNQTYHKQTPYTAFVYNIVTGPNVGKIIWEMGPVTFTQLDKRPASSAHDDEWRDLVMPYVKSMTNGEYWRADEKLNNTSMLTDDANLYPLLFVRYHEVSKDQGHNVERLFKQISDAVKAMDGVNPWGVYYNEFRQGYTIGRHIATVSFHKNWAEFDKDDNFKKTFEKVHGENSWVGFLRLYEETISNSWDEVWEYNPKLSGK